MKYKNLGFSKENARRSFLKNTVKGGLGALTISSLNANASSLNSDKQAEAGENLENKAIKPDHLIRSKPENMVWGYYGADVPPIARVKDGDIVEIQTINTAGIDKKEPEVFFKKNNLPVDEHAQDIIDIMKNVRPEPSGLKGHMLTGPVFIEGAKPTEGDWRIEIEYVSQTIVII